MREIVVEAYLKLVVSRFGGLCYKWVSPGNNGVPDRIVIFPGNVIVFVELKSPVGVLSKTQKVQHWKLEELGCFVYTLNSKVGVDLFIEDMRERKLI